MNRPRQLRVWLLPVAVLALAVWFALSRSFAAGSTTPSRERQPDANIPSDTQTTGRALFVQSCAHCHSDDARGSGEDSDGPDLHRLRISNARIATVIHHGIRGEMPSFDKKFSASDTAALIEYLRTLR